ncbi:hypothetical protein D3C87_2186750 [compost metagenome]
MEQGAEGGQLADNGGFAVGVAFAAGKKHAEVIDGIHPELLQISKRHLADIRSFC